MIFDFDAAKCVSNLDKLFLDPFSCIVLKNSYYCMGAFSKTFDINLS